MTGRPVTDVFATWTDLTVAGGPVRHYRAGDTGPPVLLLHGGMLDTAAGVWRHVAGGLAADHRVHVIDLPRHGGSRPWSGLLDDAFYRAFLGELLDALGLESAALVGLSLGAGVSVGFALDHPERVDALVAIGPGGIGARRRAQLITWLALRTPGLLRLTSRFLARRPAVVRRSMADNLVAGEGTDGFEEIVGLVVEEARAKAAHREPALDDWMVRAYGPRAMALDHLADLSRLRVPSLWVRGDRDPLVGHAELAAAAAAAPGARLTTIRDAGHIVTYDQPEETSRLVREFLAAAREGRPA
ncbi:alpha/beta fold hydrolase [Krasilnikoviella flava]|uniref:Pimeloyl-ACP methyl ester carboxylesterase n=1 Tax=Krasilnikoviella flava TaxID=526729 RepID=A0A1T5JPW7_9MICO|nr:alpha/beta fold hydrolase [Krasilnikoviella flava]SKC53461.1 Pimeloyl-ACP methyl ester carboxylesterase [Krasilnikoviella flava]